MNFEALKKFQDGLTEWRIPGCDCEVRVNHETVYRHHAGYANLETRRPMKGNEFYYLWSASKVMTVTLALRLYEEGRFLLTDPLSEYVPEFAEMTVAERQADGTVVRRKAENPIRILDLFRMTAGFGYNMNTPEILALIEKREGHATAKDMLSAFACQELNFEPGDRWGYSLGHDVLGGFVELLAGETLGEYARKNVFLPLGMEETSYGLPNRPDFEERRITQYRYNAETDSHSLDDGVPSHFLTPDYHSGGAGIVSTVDDYIKFVDALACGGVGKTGERIIGSRTIDVMRRNFLNEHQMRTTKSWSQLAGYGYGLGVRTYVDHTVSGSLGPVGEFGWQGAAGALVIADPENKVAIFYAQAMRNNQEPYILPRLRNLVYTCLER